MMGTVLGAATPMTPSPDPKAGQAYTRASVEAYLRAAAAERQRIESEIAEARQRTAWAHSEEQRLRSIREAPEPRRDAAAMAAPEVPGAPERPAAPQPARPITDRAGLDAPDRLRTPMIDVAG